MTPEKLKKLAEALGYEVHSDGPYEGLLVFTPDRMVVHYNPQSNPAQREEVLLWLLGKGWLLDSYWNPDNCNKYIMVNDLKGNVYGETLTTALMMAAEKEMGNEMLKL